MTLPTIAVCKCLDRLGGRRQVAESATKSRDHGKNSSACQTCAVAAIHPMDKRDRTLAVALLGALALGCSPAGAEPTGGVVLGLLLPFTGNASATASNLERA